MQARLLEYCRISDLQALLTRIFLHSFNWSCLCWRLILKLKSCLMHSLSLRICMRFRNKFTICLSCRIILSSRSLILHHLSSRKCLPSWNKCSHSLPSRFLCNRRSLPMHPLSSRLSMPKCSWNFNSCLCRWNILNRNACSLYFLSSRISMSLKIV